MWRVGKIKVFWFFGPVEIRVDMDRWWYRKGNAIDPHTCRASYVHTKTPLLAPLYLFLTSRYCRLL